MSVQINSNKLELKDLVRKGYSLRKYTASASNLPMDFEIFGRRSCRHKYTECNLLTLRVKSLKVTFLYYFILIE